MLVAGNVLEPDSMKQAVDTVLQRFGRIDALINAAGGNHPNATIRPEMSFFDMPPEAMRWVIDLNLVGTIIPSQVFGKVMVDRGEGVILNVSSMSAFKPLTRVARLLGGEGRGQQLHAVAGGAHGAGVLAAASASTPSRPGSS